MNVPVRNTIDHQVLVVLERVGRVAGWADVLWLADALPDTVSRVELTRALRRLHRAGHIEFWRTSWPPTGIRQAIRLR